MALSEALTLTYMVSAASAVASSDYTRPVLARVAARPAFPSQIALVGDVSDRFRLAQPLSVNFEDEAGKFIVSDDVFYMYGEGTIRREALGDYISSLTEYYELLEKRQDAPSVELFRYLQSYLQPI